MSGPNFINNEDKKKEKKEEPSDQDLHCLFSYMRGAVVELTSACLLGSADLDQTDPRETV